VSILEQETATRNTLLAQIQAKKNEIASIDRMLIELGEQSHAMFPQRESVLKEKLTGNYQ
jgi:hypothetical protein